MCTISQAASAVSAAALFSFVASLGGSISAEHGIGALKAPWLPLARSNAERALFARIRSALDPTATLNPNVLPRLSGRGVGPDRQTGASSAADGSVTGAAFGTRRPASSATAKMASALRPCSTPTMAAE